DHAAIARVCGCDSIRVDDASALRPAFALRGEMPWIIEVMTDPEAHPPLSLYDRTEPQRGARSQFKCPVNAGERNMQSRRDFCRSVLATTLVPASTDVSTAFAQGRGSTLRIAWPYDTASLDAVGIGAQRSTWCVSLHVYDRLVTYETGPGPEGTRQYDPARP